MDCNTATALQHIRLMAAMAREFIERTQTAATDADKLEACIITFEAIEREAAELEE